MNLIYFFVFLICFLETIVKRIKTIATRDGRPRVDMWF